jgi:hypothetical protein
MIIMSMSAISGISGLAPAPLDLTTVAAQAAAKPQAPTDTATAAPATNAMQPILMVPTKPPLSAAVMNELIGRQVSPYGSIVGDYGRDQAPAEGATTPGIASLPSG